MHEEILPIEPDCLWSLDVEFYKLFGIAADLIGPSLGQLPGGSLIDDHLFFTWCHI